MVEMDRICLPPVKQKGNISVEGALQLRRSTRVFAFMPLTLEEVRANGSGACRPKPVSSAIIASA